MDGQENDTKISELNNILDKDLNLVNADHKNCSRPFVDDYFSFYQRCGNKVYDSFKSYNSSNTTRKFV